MLAAAAVLVGVDGSAGVVLGGGVVGCALASDAAVAFSGFAGLAGVEIFLVVPPPFIVPDSGCAVVDFGRPVDAVPSVGALGAIGSSTGSVVGAGVASADCVVAGDEEGGVSVDDGAGVSGTGASGVGAAAFAVVVVSGAGVSGVTAGGTSVVPSLLEVTPEGGGPEASGSGGAVGCFG